MYQALVATSQTIRKFINSGLTGIPPPAGSYQAELCTPEELRALNKSGISVWLYRVMRDQDRLNDPQERVGWNQIQVPPLPLRLHYLITPIGSGDTNDAGSSEAEQVVLGRLLQLFYVHPILRGLDLQGNFSGTDIELHMRLEPMSLEEITRVWEALEGSYQLSVSYEVSVVNIDSDQTPEIAEPVTVALPEYGLIVQDT